MNKELDISRWDCGDTTCNCCGAVNFTDCKPFVSDMFKVRITGSVTILCKDCLNELVMKALMFENEEYVNGN